MKWFSGPDGFGHRGQRGGPGPSRRAAALLLCLFSGSGTEFPPETDADDDKDNDAIDHKAETPGVGKVIPVTIRWRNINCSLSDKSSTAVSFHLLVMTCPVTTGLVAEKMCRIKDLNSLILNA